MYHIYNNHLYMQGEPLALAHFTHCRPELADDLVRELNEGVGQEAKLDELRDELSTANDRISELESELEDAQTEAKVDRTMNEQYGQVLDLLAELFEDDILSAHSGNPERLLGILQTRIAEKNDAA